MLKRHRSPLPRLWLMTDERMGEGLFETIAALPARSGIVFRHYSLAPSERRVLLRRVKRLARRHAHIVTVGGTNHGRRKGAITSPVHSIPERIAAERAGAKLLLISPVYATRSHPGAVPLGRVRFGMLVRGAKAPVIALGGMNAKRAKSLRSFNIHGWAAIDSLSG